MINLHHRPILPKPGLRGWTTDPDLASLPEGLEENTPVAVLRREAEGENFIVATEDGTQWSLPPQCIDCGKEFQIENRWLPESHPEAIVAIAAEFRRLRDLVGNTLYPGTFRGDAETLETILERNGMAV